MTTRFCPMLSHYTTAGGERHRNGATRDVMRVIYSAGRALAHRLRQRRRRFVERTALRTTNEARRRPDKAFADPTITEGAARGCRRPEPNRYPAAALSPPPKFRLARHSYRAAPQEQPGRIAVLRIADDPLDGRPPHVYFPRTASADRYRKDTATGIRPNVRQSRPCRGFGRTGRPHFGVYSRSQ